MNLGLKLKNTCKEIKANKQAYLWIMPAFILVSAATIFPLVFAIDYSLYDANVFEKIGFVGFKHYIPYSFYNFRRNVANFYEVIFDGGG